MALFGGSNPMMQEEKYKNILDASFAREERMTVSGAVNKTLTLMGLLLLTASVGYFMPNMIFVWVGLIGGLVTTIWALFQPQKSNFLAPAYALLKGLALGTISAIYASMFDGIVFHAVISTLGILASMLFIYKSKIIEVTDKFRSGIAMAVGGIFFLYLINLVLSLFGVNMPFLHDSSPLSIGISIAVIVIATLNLLVDFDNIEKGAKYGAPKFMEWYSAMGLVVTLVWLYLELLRLLSKLASRD
jgi:uncharacterized YccA/Bax inhibitor family protein